MKTFTICLLCTILLIAVAGSARADGIADFDNSAAVTPAADQTADYAADPGAPPLLVTVSSARIHEEDGAMLSPGVSLVDVALTPQVTIDLECRPLDSGRFDLELISDNLDMRQITQNLMLGLHYKF